MSSTGKPVTDFFFARLVRCGMGHVIVGYVLFILFLILQLCSKTHQDRLSRALCLNTTCDNQCSGAYRQLWVEHKFKALPAPPQAFGGGSNGLMKKGHTLQFASLSGISTT
eukprot:7569236-Pyramimonas_sp.AAC.1